MTYPVKAHTQANSAQFFVHIFALFPENVFMPIVSALDEIGIDCLLDFLGEDVEYLLSELQYHDRPLNAKEKRMLKNVHEWLVWESSNRPGIDFGSLRMDDYDHYLSTKFNMVDTAPTAAPVPSATMSSMPNMMTPFVTNVKLDVKQYPLFNGDTSQWAKFKQGVLALAATHGLEDVFDTKFTVPDPSQFVWSIFNEKNKFVYSIWVSRITSGLALSTLREFEDTKDGRGAYLKFLEIYEGKHNMEQVALLALAKLNSLHLGYNMPGGVPAFITRFRESLQDLKDANEPVSDAMAKSMLLSKIRDRNYSHIVDILIASSDDFEACVTRLLDKYNMMNSGHNGPRQANKVKRGNNRQNTRNNSDKNRQNTQNTPKQNHTDYYSPEEWSKLSREKQREIMQKRGTWEKDYVQKPNNYKPNNKRVQTSGKGTRYVKNMEQSNYEEDYEEEDVKEEVETEQKAKPTPSINSIMTSIQKMNPIMINSSYAEVESLGLIDSGADTSMIGPEFYIEEQHDHRRVTIEGFGGPDHTVRNMRIGNGITAVDLPDMTILVRVNEAVISPYKTIISTNQVRSWGHKVDDVPIRYGGKQAIYLDQEDIQIPLKYIGALMYMPIRKPTRKELNEGHIFDLTDGLEWNPRQNESDEGLSIVKQPGEHGNTVHCKALTKPDLPDMDQLRRCLGWKPTEVIKKTLENTTQYAENVVRLPMRMHFKSRFPALNVKRLKETYATDTFFSSEKALGGYTCAQLYVGKESTFTEIYGMKTKNQMPETLKDFIRQWGAPSGLMSDSAKVETSKAIKDILRTYAIKDVQSEPNHQHQNYAERRIQEVKNTSTLIMDRVKAPNCLWYLCLKYVTVLLNHLSSPGLDNKTPIEKAFGVTPDISALIQFYFYQPVMYLDTNKPSYPNSKELFGYWVGVAENIGDALTYYILTPEYQVIARSTLCPAYHPEHMNLRQVEGEDAEDFSPPAAGTQDNVHDFVSLPTLPTINPLQKAHHPVTVDPENMVGFQFVKEHNGFPHKARVLQEMEEPGKYLVAIGDGDREEIMEYNDIMNFVEEQLTQDEEDQAWTFEAILNHRKTKKGKYELLIKWTTGEETWEPLSEIGNQDPVTVAMYAKDAELLDTPSWRHFQKYLNQDKKYIRAMKQVFAAKKKETKIKFGIEVPKHYKDALRLDKQNGNTLWQDAIKTELDQINSYNTFKDNGRTIPKGYKRIPVHFVFDVKFDLRRKARLVAGGHLTKPIFNDAPYTGIASIKSIRICVFLAKLNDLQICTADVGNAYLEAMTKEKLYIVAGPEFGEMEGHILIVYKALYGLRSSGARWAERLADSIRAQGYVSSYADPAIWMREQDDHWEYICVWVDDMLIISKEPKAIVDVLEKEFTLKGVGEPKYYLGADMMQLKKPEDTFVMGSGTYVKRCLIVYEQLFGTKPKKVYTPLDPKDHPELDKSEFLDEEGMHLYWKLLGMLQWAVTIGRIDIMCAVMTMGGFRCQPRIGHLNRLKRIFGFLKNYKGCSIKFRTDMPDYSMYPDEKFDWTYVYGKVEEEIPTNMPKAKGREVMITMFADANLFHDQVTGRSVTGLLMLLNKTPIDWYSKKQNGMETATYGSEFVAARIGVDKIVEMRYMLRMLGVTMTGPSYMFGDNLAVVNSSRIPDDTLKKRHNALSYHRVREAIAADIIKFIHIDGDKNPADILTKPLPSTKWYPLMKPILHWLDLEDSAA